MKIKKVKGIGGDLGVLFAEDLSPHLTERYLNAFPDEKGFQGCPSPATEITLSSHEGFTKSGMSLMPGMLTTSGKGRP